MKAIYILYTNQRGEDGKWEGWRPFAAAGRSIVHFTIASVREQLEHCLTFFPDRKFRIVRYSRGTVVE